MFLPGAVEGVVPIEGVAPVGRVVLQVRCELVEPRLYDVVDPDALEQVIASADEAITVQFTVEGIPLDVSPEGVEVIVEDESDAVTE